MASATEPRGNGNGSPLPGAARRPPWLRHHIARLVALDAIAGCAAMTLARVWNFGLEPASVEIRSVTLPYSALALAIVPTWLAVLAVTGCYEVGPFGSATGELRRVVRAGADFLAVVAVAYFVVHLENLARGFLVVIPPLAVLLTLGLRAVARTCLVAERRRGRAVRRAVIVGSRPSVAQIVGHLVDHPGSGLEAVGACVPGRLGPVAARGRRVPVLGPPDAVFDAIRSTGADTLVLTGSLVLDQVRSLTWTLEGTGVAVFVLPALTRQAQLDVRPVAGLPLVYVSAAGQGLPAAPSPAEPMERRVVRRSRPTLRRPRPVATPGARADNGAPPNANGGLNANAVRRDDGAPNANGASPDAALPLATVRPQEPQRS